ncbi:MAG: hypothetical protein IJC56_06535, partial [Clostridia bacterium]|nr:hypothetical protein [Clostridia bacterium]
QFVKGSRFATLIARMAIKPWLQPDRQVFIFLHKCKHLFSEAQPFDLIERSAVSPKAKLSLAN